MNIEQLDILTAHVSTKPEIKAGLKFHFIDGLSVYAAEHKAKLPRNSLTKKVNRIVQELDYIKAFIEAQKVSAGSGIQWAN